MNSILRWLRTASRLVRAGAIAWVAQSLGMSSASRTGMNTCVLTVRGRLVVAARTRRSGRTMRRAVRTGRRIRSILRCRNQRRGRSTTTDRGRNARLPAVRGHRGRLAISLGDVRFWAAAAYGCSTLSGALRDVAQRGRIPRRCAYSCVMISLPGSISILALRPGTKHASLISHIPPIFMYG